LQVRFSKVTVKLDDYIIRFSFGRFILFSREKLVFRVVGVGRKRDEVMETHVMETLNISKGHNILHMREAKIKFIKENFGDNDIKMYAFSNTAFFTLI
jgi:hypothetical protein